MNCEEQRTSLIGSIPQEKQASRGWALHLNGELKSEVTELDLFNPRFGRLRYGLTPGGYDGWAFEEIGGGGAVNIPYCIGADELLVGLVEEQRDFMGGEVLNVPRGFLNPGETHFETAQRELAEEMGVSASDVKIEALEGEPENPNSAFFITAQQDQGVRFYRVEFQFEMLEKRDDLLVIDERLIKPVSGPAKKIMASRFVPWREAVKVSDMFTSAGIARLAADILVEDVW